MDLLLFLLDQVSKAESMATMKDFRLLTLSWECKFCIQLCAEYVDDLHTFNDEMRSGLAYLRGCRLSTWKCDISETQA